MELRKKTVFCEFEFLDKFISQQPKIVEPTTDSISQMECWLSLYKFIGKADLIFNKPIVGTFEENQWFKEENQWFKYLLKEGTTAPERFPCYCEDTKGLKSIGDEILNSVILTTWSDDICDEISKKYGIIVINTNNWHKKKHLYIDNGYAIRKGDTNVKGWNFLQGPQKKLNICNSLIIIDGYLCDDNKKWDEKTGSDKITMSWQNKLEWNLKPILLQALPRRLSENIEFEIIVITGQMDNASYKEQCDKIQEIINQLCSEKNLSIRIKISIYLNVINYINKKGEEKHKSVFHDRCIISNNLWIGSGYGFGLFDNSNGKMFPIQNTTVNSMYPFFQSHAQWLDVSYLQTLNNLAAILSANTEKGKNYWGNDYSGTCRMVSHYLGNDKKKEHKILRLSETPELPKSNLKGKIDLDK